MDKSRVCVLLSAYNGERYIEEQIRSVLAQKDVDVFLLIRDDGSKDSTVSLIKTCAEGRENVRFYAEGNVGVQRSFFDLLLKSPEADYYAYCDQDDFWDEDKLASAVDRLKTLDPDKPGLYYSNLRIADSELRTIRYSHNAPQVQKNKYSALAEPMGTGCTMVMNRCAAELIRSHVPKKCSNHDSWTYLVCRFFGNTVYDAEPHISYRQHSANKIGTYTSSNVISNYRRRFSNLFHNNGEPRYTNACELVARFGGEMTKKDLVKAKEVALYKTSFLRKCRLLFDPSIHTTSWQREIAYRCLIISEKV